MVLQSVANLLLCFKEKEVTLALFTSTSALMETLSPDSSGETCTSFCMPIYLAAAEQTKHILLNS